MTTTIHKPNLTYHSSKSSCGHRTWIIHLAGGLGGDLSLLSIEFKPACIIRTDVPQEVEKNREILRAGKNVHCVQLGQNQTSKSLMSDFLPEDNPLFKAFGSCISQSGMGQIPGLGRLAAIQYIQSPEFDQLVEELREQYMLANGGMFPPMVIHQFHSMNGGVGSGAAPILIRALQKRLTESGVPVEVHLHLVDSASYIGLGKSIELNCATTISSVVDLTKEVNHASKSNSVFNTRFISLPPTGTDRELRKQYAQLESQAWFSDGPQEWWQIVGPNVANSNPLGNIIQTNCEFFNAIPTPSIVNEVVRSYHHEIDLALRFVKSKLHTVRHIDAVIEQETLPRAELEDVLAGHQLLNACQFLQAVQEPGARLQFNLFLEDIRGRSFECSKLPDYFVWPSQSLDSAIDDIETVLTVRDKLVQEQSQTSREEQALERKVKKLRDSISRILSRPSRFRRGKRKQQTKIRQMAASLRGTSDRLLEVKALIIEIKKCIKVAGDLLARQRGMIDAVLRMLASHRLPLNDFELSGLVYFQGTNDIFGRLLAMLPMSKSTQAQLLATTATAVTEEGLKYILRTNSADPHHLAAVVVGPAFTPGTWIGGLTKTPNETLVIFPRMSAAVGESLRDEIRKARPDWLVFFTDSCALGADVVRINICYPTTKEECVPGFLGKLLKQSEQSPLAVLNKIAAPE